MRGQEAACRGHDMALGHVIHPMRARRTGSQAGGCDAARNEPGSDGPRWCREDGAQCCPSGRSCETPFGAGCVHRGGSEAGGMGMKDQSEVNQSTKVRYHHIPAELRWAVGIGTALAFPILWSVLIPVAVWRLAKVMELSFDLWRQRRRGPTLFEMEGLKFEFLASGQRRLGGAPARSLEGMSLP